MTVNLILWLTVFWLPLLICWMLINETKFKKNILLGLTLPQEAHEDPEIKEICDKFKKSEWIVCAFLILTVIPCCLFIKNTGASMTVWGIWIDLCIILPYVPYIAAHNRIKEIKAARGWFTESKKVYVNTSAVNYGKWLSAWLFIPAILLCLVPIIFDSDLTWVYVMFAAMNAFFYFAYRYLYRNKAEMVDENTELTKALSAVRKNNWGRMWLYTAYGMALYSLSLWLMADKPVLSYIVMIAATILLCVLVIRTEMKTRRVQEKLTKDSGADWYVDEDEHWIYGILYYNPDDSRNIINARIGTNSSVNLAHLPGKIMMGFAVLMIALLPLMGVIMGSVDSSPITIEVAEDDLTAKSGLSKYTISMDNIENAVLIETLPDHLRRRNGTATDHTIKGQFSADDYSSITVMADPTISPFIVIETKEHKYYLFGCRDSEETKALYKDIIQNTD